MESVQVQACEDLAPGMSIQWRRVSDGVMSAGVAHGDGFGAAREDNSLY